MNDAGPRAITMVAVCAGEISLSAFLHNVVHKVGRVVGNVITYWCDATHGNGQRLRVHSAKKVGGSSNGEIVMLSDDMIGFHN